MFSIVEDANGFVFGGSEQRLVAFARIRFAADPRLLVVGMIVATCLAGRILKLKAEIVFD